MGYISLGCVTLQTTAQVFIIKWAHAGTTREGYLNTSVVILIELVKCIVSFALVVLENGSLAQGVHKVYEHFTRSYLETLKVGVPALLYTVQNNLQLFSLEMLSMGVQQVTYQLKILTTAGLSVVILGKVLDRTKWSSLVILLVGVTCVQWPRSAEAVQSADFGGNTMMGFLAVLAGCFTSGLASVYV